MSESGQKAKYSLGANVFRFALNSGHTVGFAAMSEKCQTET